MINSNDIKYYLVVTINLIISLVISVLIYSQLINYFYHIDGFSKAFMKHLLLVMSSNLFYLSLIPYIILCSFIMFIAIYLFLDKKFNIYLPTLKYTRFVKWNELRKITPSVVSKTGIVLGIFKRKYLKTSEPFSILLVAPAGSG